MNDKTKATAPNETPAEQADRKQRKPTLKEEIAGGLLEAAIDIAVELIIG